MQMRETIPGRPFGVWTAKSEHIGVIALTWSIVAVVPGGDSVTGCGGDVVPTGTSPNCTGSSLTTTTSCHVDEKCGAATRHDARPAAKTMQAETRRFTLTRIVVAIAGVNAW